jgi:lipopolysaccharide cholinephosphotransferase
MFPHTFSKLRNSNTAFIEKGNAALPINHGICLDIFPLDGHPAGAFQKKVFHLKKRVLTAMRVCVLDDRSSKKMILRNTLMKKLGIHKLLTYTQKWNELLYKKYSVETSELWCNYGNWQGKLDYSPRWHYGNGVWANFEGIKVRIPEEYDAYLTQKYGDWRSDPPIEKQRSHHESVVIDTEKSYIYYKDIADKSEE